MFTGLYAIILIPSDFEVGRKRKKTCVRFLRFFLNVKREGLYVAINTSKIRPKWSLHWYVCIYTYKHGGLYKLTHFVPTIIIVNDKTIDSYCSYYRWSVDRRWMGSPQEKVYQPYYILTCCWKYFVTRYMYIYMRICVYIYLCICAGAVFCTVKS